MVLASVGASTTVASPQGGSVAPGANLPLNPQQRQEAVVVVGTAEELRRAVQAGSRDIEIRSHLDLTALKRTPTLAPYPSFHPLHGLRSHLLYVKAATQSIRGNCEQPPAAESTTATVPPMLPLKPRQCVVVVGDSALLFLGGQTWLDNVYFRLQRTRVNPAMSLLVAGMQGKASPGTEELYLSDVTVQGAVRGQSRAIAAYAGSKVLAQRCEFFGLAGGLEPFDVVRHGSLNFVDSSFSDIATNGPLVFITYGFVRFQNAVFSGVRVPNNKWVAAWGPDDWLHVASSKELEVSLKLDSWQRDVTRPPAVVADNDARTPTGSSAGCRESPVYEVAYDAIYDLAEAYMHSYESGVSFDPDGDVGSLAPVEGSPNVSAPKMPSWAPQPTFAMPEEEWFRSIRASLLQHPHTQAPGDRGGMVELPGAATSARTNATSRAESPGPGSSSTNGDMALAAAVRDVAVDNCGLSDLQELARAFTPIPSISTGTGVFAAAAARGTGSLQLPPHIITAAAVVMALLCAAAVALLCWERRQRRLVEARCNDSVKKAGRMLSDTSGTESDFAGVTSAPASAEPNAPSDNNTLPVFPEHKHTPAAGIELSTMHAAHEYAQPSHLAFLIAAASPPGCGPDAVSAAGDDAAGVSDRDTLHVRTGEPTTSSQWWVTTVDHPVALQQEAPVTADTHNGSTAISTPPDRAAGDADARSEETPRDTVKRPERGTWAHACNCARMTRLITARPSRRNREVARVHQLLDGFTNGEMFLGRFVMGGRRERHCSGSTLVQYATDSGGGYPYVIRFFLDRRAFRTEVNFLTACGALYAADARPVAVAVPGSPAMRGADRGESPPLPQRPASADFLPQVEAVCQEGAQGLVGVRGRPLPPCVVMERGESLQAFVARDGVDRSTAILVLRQLSGCLVDMHDAGYAHRDVQPRSVLWLPHERRWAAVGFGSAARIGSASWLRFTLTYAAPEVVAAFAAGQQCVDVTAAQDAWSLGVLALELLTGRPAFDVISHGPAEIVRMLTSQPRSPRLPWEGARAVQLEALTRPFWTPLMQLLHRDPASRSTVHTFRDRCSALAL